jgi:predicted  nucleic acid-binding Zn-ribbon protein
MRRTTGALAVLGVLLAGWTVLRAQTAAPAAVAPPDIMPALLEEVRGLRAALEQMSSAGARVQLALGRLQLQEARMNTIIKRADDARTRLAGLQREQAGLEQQLKGFESELREARTRATGAPEGPSAEQLAGIVQHHKQQLALHNAEVQRVAAEEAGYAAEVSSEQARWIELNQRLEDLERALRPLR